MTTMRAVTVDPIHAQAIMDGHQWIVTQAAKPKDLGVVARGLGEPPEIVALHCGGTAGAIVALVTVFACIEIVAAVPDICGPNRSECIVVDGTEMTVWHYLGGTEWEPEHNHAFDEALRLADFTAGRWALFLTSIKRLDAPIPCPGGGNDLWDLPVDAANTLTGRRR